MDQSLAVMLWQLCYSKISFIALVPEANFSQYLHCIVKMEKDGGNALWGYT